MVGSCVRRGLCSSVLVSDAAAGTALAWAPGDRRDSSPRSTGRQPSAALHQVRAPYLPTEKHTVKGCQAAIWLGTHFLFHKHHSTFPSFLSAPRVHPSWQQGATKHFLPSLGSTPTPPSFIQRTKDTYRRQSVPKPTLTEL